MENQKDQEVKVEEILEQEVEISTTSISQFCIELDKLLVKTDYCDSCATIKEIKTVSFKNTHEQLYTINQCKKCFISEWKIDWDTYLQGLMILKQERWEFVAENEKGKLRCCYCPNFAVTYKNGLSLCQDCLNDDLDFIQIKDKKELSKDDCE